MVTSTAEIEKAALEVFERKGFEATTIEDIAAAAGISRRTFFRYFPSKNDIVFGNFGDLLDVFEEWFDATDDDLPMFEVITQAMIRFNRSHDDEPAAHRERERMKLILHTPAIRANASLRHAEWGAVIARFAAKRLGVPEDDVAAQLVGHVSLATANTAYEAWIRDESSDLSDLITRAFKMTDSLGAMEDSKVGGRRRQTALSG